MKDFLMKCFYDGMKIDAAMNLAESCYNKKVSARTLNTVRKEIKDFSTLIGYKIKARRERIPAKE